MVIQMREGRKNLEIGGGRKTWSLGPYGSIQESSQRRTCKYH
jgi:hypothetical protein